MTSLDTVTDDELVRLVAAGDRTAFATLFRRRQSDVYRFALHLSGEPSVADDVTQETFLTVMREAWRYLPGRGSAAAWLCGIARNHARRRLERDQRLVAMGDGGERAGEPGPGDPLADLTRAENIEAIRRAVLGLPLPYREAIVACDLQEMSYADAAVALGCAVGTVRSRLHRGRALLVARLSGTARAGSDRERDSGLAVRATRTFV